ncbi:MAG: glycoside hydrolase [Clostridia bacterium]|nr:glycoside hydrolase [Clostridia bacterium]
MSVYKLTYGTPEKLTPTKFAPESKINVTEVCPRKAPEIVGKKTKRGYTLELPLNPGNEVYGFGLQLKGFEQRGHKKTMRPNADPPSNTGDSHAPIPFFVTTEGWGLFVDSARYVDFYLGYTKKNSNTVSETNELKTTFAELYATREVTYTTVITIDIPAVDGVDIYVFKGENILELVKQYNMFSGGGCDAALWGLGNLYRCHSYFTEEQVLKMANDFREMNIPCDIIGLEPGWQTCAYSSSLVWDKTRFPNYENMLKTLNEMGFKVNLWEHCFVHPTSPLHEKLEQYSGDFKVWNGLVPDFALKEARDIFVEHHKPYNEKGVSGYKLDECDGSDYTGHWTFPNNAEFPSGLDGEQYHNLFGLLYAKTMLETYGENKTLAEVRNMGALASSYPYVLYSDLYDHNDFIRGVATSGFSGILWSPEVRHANSREDLIRRVQTVVFSVQSLVNAFYLDKMPWIDVECTDEIRKLFELRMSLVPYLYSAFNEYKKTGKPPVRALVCDYTDDANTFKVWNQYMFGDSMLVAPMTETETKRDVYLPQGEWYNFFDKKKYIGGQTITIETTDIPVFVMSGSIIPLAKPVQYIAEDTVFELTLECYGDTSEAKAYVIDDNGFKYSDDEKVIELTENTTSISSKRYTVNSIVRY